MLEKLLSVVGDHHDERAVEDALRVEPLEEAPEQVVGVADAGVVAVREESSLARRELHLVEVRFPAALARLDVVVRRL